MKTVAELKKIVISGIDGRKDEILKNAEMLLQNPETGFKEYKTADIVKTEFLRLGLQPQMGLALTGVRADIDSGRPGPKIAIVGELDALLVPTHPFADAATGAAHACGHHAQLTMMLAAASVLTPLVKELSGSLAFIAVPAEEFQNLNFCKQLIAEKKIQYCGGKPEFIRLGLFDDVDVILMIHAGHDTFVPESYNGFCMKQITFTGKAAHGGLSPWNGINAASMARQALNMLDSQRDTLNDKDSVRIHGIVSDGGSAVNVVPAKAVLELQVRAKTPEAVKRSCELVDRCMKGAAMAFGGSVRIENMGGYMPYRSCPELNELHGANLHELNGGNLGCCGHRGSSTDMGDASMLHPCLHAYSGGFSGTPHTKDFVVNDPEKAYLDGAKLLAMDAVDLLTNESAIGKKIAAFPPVMTKEEYLQYKNKMLSTEEFSYDQK